MKIKLCILFFADSCGPRLPRDCIDLKHRFGKEDDGEYTIYIGHRNEEQETQVYCDMTTDGGGWTVCISRQSLCRNILAHVISYRKPFLECTCKFITARDLNVNLVSLKTAVSHVNSFSWSSFLHCCDDSISGR